MIGRYYEGNVVNVDESADPIAPGCRVRHKDDPKSYGIVVAIEVEHIETDFYGKDDATTTATQHVIVVLWSREPEDSLNNFVLPLVKRVNYPLLAKSLISIRPMSMPSSEIFYMDYKYGDKEKK